MREIKFRIWDKDFAEYKMWDKQPIIPLQSIVNDSQYVIEQFTGLKDKNGKEIYEGDILEYDYTHRKVKYVVRWWDQCAKFDYYGSRIGYTLVAEYVHETEIIGNIHENPELFGGNMRGRMTFAERYHRHRAYLCDWCYAPYRSVDDDMHEIWYHNCLLFICPDCYEALQRDKKRQDGDATEKCVAEDSDATKTLKKGEEAE